MSDMKLKAFDKLSKLIFDNDEIRMEAGKVTHLKDEEWFEVNDEDIEIIMFTGLLDKNREIYEEDIYQHPDGTIFIVKFINGSFRAYYPHDNQDANVMLQIGDKGQARYKGNTYEKTYGEIIKQPLPKFETWEFFASYLLDNCEGEIITEESLQHWLVNSEKERLKQTS